ncbi:MAG: hypothetical protein QG649_57 [Patescibacteria group bacterium]|nr:hypothetical protein [Patescibacteria group bacterium]
MATAERTVFTSVRNLTMKRKRITRKHLIVGLVSLGLILAGGLYTWSSITVWRNYESRLLTEQKTYASLKDQALKGETPASRLQAVQKLDDKLMRRNELCSLHPLYGWQAVVVPAIRDGVQRCKDKVRQLDAIAKPLGILRSYLDTEAKIRSIMTTLAPNEAFTEKNWKEKGLARIEQAKRALDELRTNEQSGELKRKALSLIATTEKAWQALITANDAKDKNAYLAASDQVVKSYADFSALADASDEILQKQVQAVTNAAAKL